jgi:hypothetical protein
MVLRDELNEPQSRSLPGAAANQRLKRTGATISVFAGFNVVAGGPGSGPDRSGSAVRSDRRKLSILLRDVERKEPRVAEVSQRR